MAFYRKFLHHRFLYFTMILLLKGMLAWSVVFAEGPSWTMLVTEVPFIWVVFCLIERFAGRLKMMIYVTVNLLVTMLYFTISVYYKYYGTIVTYHALTQATKVAQVSESTYSLFKPYYLVVFLDIVVLAVMLWRNRKHPVQWKAALKPLNKSVIYALLILSVFLCSVSVLPHRASMNENKQAQEMGLLNYEVYRIFSDIAGNEEMVQKDDITQDAIDGLKGIQEPAAPRYWGADRGRNVIILQLESLQNFLIGLKIDGQEVTPNLNKLAQENFHFTHFYTMVGQGTTSDAEFVVNTSLYIPKYGAATERYVKKELPSLPKLMSANGYNTATFHTNSVEFWNRSELYKAVGWDHYYDQTYYGDEDHIAFGSSDEVLYAKTIGKLEQMDLSDKPFYAQVISMSAHHPFKIPESKYKMKLPERFEGTLVGDYIRAQNYADYALGKFIDDLKAKGLWDDSIILMYGDHQGLPLYALDNNDKDLLKELLGHDYGYSDMLNIPLILHAPGVTYPSKINETGGQIDILPTLANLTGASLNGQIHFGQDLLNQPNDLLPMRHFLPSGSFLTGRTMFLPGIGYDDGADYSLDGGNQISGGTTKEAYDRALQLLNMSDSYVAQLPDRPDAK